MNRKFIASWLIMFCAMGLIAQNVPAKYEMRAGWMASVANISWPAKKGLSNEELKAGYIQFLDSLVAVRANAVIMQVRPTGDSFYPSSQEPWSIYLTGKQGQAPTPLWDPMEFLIREAHKRGLEFHAWMNPYRVAQHNDSTLIAENHAMREHPEWFVQYGKQWYFDPGVPSSADYTVKMVEEYVSRYDIDGIHFDDYFYPYKVTDKDAEGKTYVVDFPDSVSWEKYGEPFFKNKDDWRRNNVDQLIKRLSKTITTLKPWVKFGISPFGVWRNASSDPVRGSDTQAGVQNYDDLYADILLWTEKGWIDYVTPQLYWKIGKKIVDYPILLDWWIKYSYGRHLYIGHSMGNGAEEIQKQITMLREKGYENAQGSFYWSANSLVRTPRPRRNADGTVAPAPTTNPMNEMLRKENAHIAIVPPMPWKDMTAAPEVKDVKVAGTQTLCEVSWTPVYSDNLMYFLVYKFPKGVAVDTSNPQYLVGKVWYDNQSVASYIDKEGEKGEFTYAITTLTRNNIESAPVSKTVKISKSGIK